MGRPLRFIPPDSLVEITSRTVHGRFLLRPSRELNTIVYGILARAACRYRVRVCAFVYLSNHAHLLLQPANAYELAGFMAYVNGNLAKEAGRLHRWRERFWSRRYRAIVVSDDEEDQVARLHYILSQGCKEMLVKKPQEWPGATSVHALLSGEPRRTTSSPARSVAPLRGSIAGDRPSLPPDTALRELARACQARGAMRRPLRKNARLDGASADYRPQRSPPGLFRHLRPANDTALPRRTTSSPARSVAPLRGAPPRAGDPVAIQIEHGGRRVSATRAED